MVIDNDGKIFDERRKNKRRLSSKPVRDDKRKDERRRTDINKKIER